VIKNGQWWRGAGGHHGVKDRNLNNEHKQWWALATGRRGKMLLISNEPKNSGNGRNILFEVKTVDVRLRLHYSMVMIRKI